MDFNLTEQEKMLQNAAKDFALKSVQQRAGDIDSTGEFPFGLVKEMGNLGYLGLPYPTEYGGGGAGYIGLALVLEQICRASMTVGAVIAVNTVTQEAIFRFVKEAQKKALLAPLLRGTALSCIAFTEADTGSDPRLITTLSRKGDGGYVVTGQKQFVALAPVAKLALVFAKNHGEGLNAFVIDTSSHGFDVRDSLPTLGLRGLGTSVVYLDDVYVPEQDLIGEEGQGFDILLEVISIERLGVAIQGVAVAHTALDLSIAYSRQRRALGRPIARLPSIQWHLAEMACRTEAARWLAYQTAFLRDQGSSIRYESSLAKLFASRVAVEVTSMAMQVYGAYGTMKTLPIERLYRDAKMTEIYVGVSEIQRSIIADRLI